MPLRHALALWLLPTLLAAAPLTRDQLQAHRVTFDAAADLYARLRMRADRLEHAPPPWVPGPLRLVLPPEVARLGAPDAVDLGALPARTREALATRLAHEWDRGFRHWARVAMAPRRVLTYDPPGPDGQGSFSRNIYQEWDRDLGEPPGLPDLAALLASLALPPPEAPPPGPPGDWEALADDLVDALGTAEAYHPRVGVPPGRGVDWVNAGHWRRVTARALGAASAFVAALARERSRCQVELVDWLASRIPSMELPAPGAEAARWDQVFDRRVLGPLPGPMRLGVERWLALAHLRGAWEAKRARLRAWQRGGEGARRRDRETLRSAKSELDLTGAYRYQLDAPGPGL